MQFGPSRRQATWSGNDRVNDAACRLLKEAHLRRWRARAALPRTDSVRFLPRLARRLASGHF